MRKNTCHLQYVCVAVFTARQVVAYFLQKWVVCRVEHVAASENGVEFSEMSRVKGDDSSGTQQVLTVMAPQL